MTELSHVDASGAANMVDVGAKAITERQATATGKVLMPAHVVRLIQENALKKGDVLAVARVAGIMAAKRTAELIPLCHSLSLSKVSIDFDCDELAGEVRIRASCRLHGQTGVEMEALTAVSVAALTIYDMCKAVEPGMVISTIALQEKTGGKRGLWLADNENPHD